MLLIPGLCGQSIFLRVPHFHQAEETLHANSLFMEPGGKGYNQAVAARRMGAEVFFVGAVGADEHGRACQERLDKEGIENKLFVHEQRTALATILTDDAGDNQVTVFRGACLTAADIEALADAFDRAKLLLLTPEIPEAAFDRAVQMAKERDIKIILNPAPYAPFLERYMGDCWCVTPNRHEARQLLKTDAPMAEALKASPLPRALVTLGAEGALVKDEGEVTAIQARPISARDTTGAGDCLNGALCACLMKGMSLKQAAEYAVRAATLSVAHEHVLDGMPTFSAVEQDDYTG